MCGFVEKCEINFIKHGGELKLEDWKKAIITMIQVKQEVIKHDKIGLWHQHLPAVAATDKQIEKVEEILGFNIDNSYKNFLKFSNGWKAVYQTVDLFGTDELSGSPIMDYAFKLLKELEEDIITPMGYRLDELLPIAATFEDIDIFVLTKPSSPEPGIVIWFAGGEIDRFSNFSEYFLAMIDYNRLEVERLKRKSIL